MACDESWHSGTGKIVRSLHHPEPTTTWTRASAVGHSACAMRSHLEIEVSRWRLDPDPTPWRSASSLSHELHEPHRDTRCKISCTSSSLYSPRPLRRLEPKLRALPGPRWHSASNGLFMVTACHAWGIVWSYSEPVIIAFSSELGRAPVLQQHAALL